MSGFGWIMFLGKSVPLLLSDQYTLLHNAFDRSYFEIGYGLSSEMWFWYRPETVASIVFMVLLFLFAKKNELKSRTFIALFATVITVLGMTHPPEMVFFVGLIPFLVFFVSKENWRSSLKASILGILLVSGILGFDYAVLGYRDTSVLIIMPLLLAVLLFSMGLPIIRSKLLKIRFTLAARFTASNLKDLPHEGKTWITLVVGVVIAVYIALGLSYYFTYSSSAAP